MSLAGVLNQPIQIAGEVATTIPLAGEVAATIPLAGEVTLFVPRPWSYLLDHNDLFLLDDTGLALRGFDE